MKKSEVKEYVKKRYSEIARSEEPCCTGGCCTPSTTDVALQIGYTEEDLKNIPEAASLGLGCGNPVALANLKEGETVLDLGSGGGIDVFLAVKKVSTRGMVIGVDMTEDMVNRSRDLARKYEYDNVDFKLGEIEKLPIEDESIDAIISNCVINLAPDKAKVFQEAFRVLKPTGRLLISDIVTEGELPNEVKQSFAAWAGCIAGALEKSKYLNTIKNAGFQDVRIIAESTYNLDVTEELTGKITSVQVEACKNV
jgi:ubiquinone/menaquinone biosynthesis C-methylase UbiE